MTRKPRKPKPKKPRTWEGTGWVDLLMDSANPPYVFKGTKRDATYFGYRKVHYLITEIAK